MSQQGAIRLTELETQLNVRQSLVSHYLIQMRKVGILSTRREGNAVFYLLQEPALATFIPLLLSVSDQMIPYSAMGSSPA